MVQANSYKLVIKGAPETILPKVSSFIDPQNNQCVNFNNQASFYL
jgi:magnesium-transporting ATPase (P-type)